MSKGEFTLRDMCSQFQHIMDMVGPMKKLTFWTRRAIRCHFRIHQITAGPGTKEVQMLLQEHKQFKDMVSKMGKGGMVGKGAQAKQ
jgi:signal recognition particle GTPase